MRRGKKKHTLHIPWRRRRRRRRRRRSAVPHRLCHCEKKGDSAAKCAGGWRGKKKNPADFCTLAKDKDDGVGDNDKQGGRGLKSPPSLLFLIHTVLMHSTLSPPGSQKTKATKNILRNWGGDLTSASPPKKRDWQTGCEECQLGLFPRDFRRFPSFPRSLPLFLEEARSITADDEAILLLIPLCALSPCHIF